MVRRIPDGTDVWIEVIRPRNNKRLRFWWALVGFVVFQIGEDAWNRESVGEMLKLLCGHFNLIETPCGEQHRVPKSISFAAMSEDEFAELTGKAVRQAARMLQGLGQARMTPEEVKRAMAEFDERWS